MTTRQPNLVDLGANFWSKLARYDPKFAQLGRIVAEGWPTLAQTRRTFHQFWSMCEPSLGRCWLTLTNIWPNSTKLCRIPATQLPNLGRCRPESAKFDPNLAHIFPTRLTLVEHRPIVAQVGQPMGQGGQFGSQLDRCSATGSTVRQLWDSVSATFGQLRNWPGPPWVTFPDVWRAIVR